jgi:hypothetical protein
MNSLTSRSATNTSALQRVNLPTTPKIADTFKYGGRAMNTIQEKQSLFEKLMDEHTKEEEKEEDKSDSSNVSNDDNKDTNTLNVKNKGNIHQLIQNYYLNLYHHFI